MNGNKKILVLSLLCIVFTIMFCNTALADEDGDVFKALRDKTSAFAIQLRVLAYVISCFGIIMFTFLAISGKINFKHLGYIFISLFMLSATGAIIDYFSGSHAHLESKFGDTYMKDVSHSSLGS